MLLESDEETRYIATARTSLDQPLALESLTVPLKDSGLLPDAGFFLHGSPTGDLVLREARERNNLILEIAAEPPEAAIEHRIRANTLAEMLFRVQAMVRHAYRATITRTGFRYSWAEPSSERPGRDGVSHAQAASLVEALSSVTDLGVEAVRLEGTFEKFNRGTGAWGLLTAEGSRSGRMREGSADLDGLEVGGRYVFHCDEVIEEVDVTGRELRTLYLHRHETA